MKEQTMAESVFSIRRLLGIGSRKTASAGNHIFVTVNNHSQIMI
jgi:hypothetical protein